MDFMYLIIHSTLYPTNPFSTPSPHSSTKSKSPNPPKIKTLNTENHKHMSIRIGILVAQKSAKIQSSKTLDDLTRLA